MLQQRSRPLPVCHGGVCTVKVREEENSVTPTQTLQTSGEKVLFWS